MARKKKRHPLRTIGVLLLVLAAGGCWFALQQDALKKPEIEVFSARLPDAFDGLRISVVSDVHGKEFGENNARLIRAVSKQAPDLIAITGDIIDAQEEIGMLPALAKGLSAIAPTYYVTGNHEWAIKAVPEITGILEQCGVTVLENEYLPLKRGDESLVLAGIHDPNGRADQKTLLQMSEELRAEFGDPFVLLLAHRNTGFPEYARCGMDLILSGHGHGGIIRLPFTDGLIGTERNLFPTWTSGLYEQDGAQMVVSRGLGNLPKMYRLFNRPDLPVVVLHCIQDET